MLNWRSNCINSRLRTKVKKAANFRAAVWFLAGMQLHWFLNQNCNLGLDWTNYKLRTNVNSDMFFPPFPFKWNDIVSCTVHIKKKDPNGAVLNGTVGLLLPLDVRDRGRRRFFYRLLSIFLRKTSKRRQP